MSSKEKSIPEKYVTVMVDGAPVKSFTPEYKAYLRHEARWRDRIASAQFGLAGAGVIGALVAAASQVPHLYATAMNALTTVAADSGVLAAAGVAALGVVGGVVGVAATATVTVLVVASALSLTGAIDLYDKYKLGAETGFRPVSALAAGIGTLAAAVGMALTAAPEAQQGALRNVSSPAAAFDAASRGGGNTADQPEPAAPAAQQALRAPKA